MDVILLTILRFRESSHLTLSNATAYNPYNMDKYLLSDVKHEPVMVLSVEKKLRIWY